MTRGVDPRRLRAPLRAVLVLGAIAAFALAFSSYEFAQIPHGEPSVLDLPPGTRVIVREPEATGPDVGDAVFYLSARGSIEVGRVAGRPGDPIERDASGRLVRCGGGPWFPAPVSLRDDAATCRDWLILSDNPARRDVGGFRPVEAVLAVIVVALPF